MSNKQTCGISTAIGILVFMISCNSDNHSKDLRQEFEDKVLSLEEVLQSGDTITDLSTAIKSMEYKIDSLYDLIQIDAKKVNAHEIMLGNISKCKVAYKELYEGNADIYREVFANGTMGGTAANSYYYHYLCDYYKEAQLLQRELSGYFQELHENGIDTIIYHQR